MNAVRESEVLARWLEQQRSDLETLIEAVQRVLSCAGQPDPAALTEAVHALGAACELGARQQAARHRLQAQWGRSYAELRACAMACPDPEGQRLREAERLVHERTREAVRLTRRLAFVVTQMLHVNGEILAILSRGADPGGYGRGGRCERAAAPGRVRAEA
ncbi:MAG: hypothetical protein D6776_07900 [Planctomycetota bacterium]|nr:MAG: hypothetical protein D6776_07900 [Planctomycetota bacterium]